MLTQAKLIDRFGRTAEKLRISVTDRCNFRCRYCMPEQGLKWFDKSKLLSFEELTTLTQIFSELGISQIRITGGEPLLRKELPSLIEKISAIQGIKNIAITTNGFLLPQFAQPLYQAGIRTFNVSLDSLQPDRFNKVVRGDYYERVLEGLKSLEQFPDCQIKLNVVVMQGFNDDEAVDFAHLAREKNYKVRFIEFMPLGSNDNWLPDTVVTGQVLVEQINRILPIEKIEEAGQNPAERWRFRDGSPGELGFINSVSKPFCQSCNRVRLTSDGQLRTCLFSLKETNLKKLLRQGLSINSIKKDIIQAISNKEAGHLINQEKFERPERSMSAIGG